MLITCLHDVRLGLCARLVDVALFHWIVQSQDSYALLWTLMHSWQRLLLRQPRTY